MLRRDTFGIIGKQNVSRGNNWHYPGFAYMGTRIELLSLYPLYQYSFNSQRIVRIMVCIFHEETWRKKNVITHGMMTIIHIFKIHFSIELGC